MWLAASEASNLTYEEVAGRLRVDVRQGLTWQEAGKRRQIAGYYNQQYSSSSTINKILFS